MAVIPDCIDIAMGVTIICGKAIMPLGRLHPQKGASPFVAAWAPEADRHSDWQSRIICPSEAGYWEALDRQVVELCVQRAYFDGPRYRKQKLNTYRQPGTFVLLTSKGEFCHGGG